jgi:hypothetical protein
MARKKILSKAQIDELLNLSENSDFSTSDSDFEESENEDDNENEDEILPGDDDDDNIATANEFRWTSQPIARNKIPFTGTPGIQKNIENGQDTLE